MQMNLMLCVIPYVSAAGLSSVHTAHSRVGRTFALVLDRVLNGVPPGREISDDSCQHGGLFRRKVMALS